MEQNFVLTRKKKIVLALVMFVIWAAITLPLVAFTGKRPEETHVYEMDEGWQLTINDKEYRNVTISKLTFPVTQKGDLIIMSRRIPSEVTISNPVLKLLTVHSAFQVFLDEEEIYEYGMDRMREDKMTGYGTSRVSLPASYPGRELKIVMYVTEDDAFDGLPELSIEDGAMNFRSEMSEGRFAITISVFLIGFGILAMLFSVVAIFRNDDMLQVFCVAMFAILTGIWTLCNAGILEFLIPEIYIKSAFEYLTLYSAALPLTFYFYKRVRERTCPKALRVCFWVLIALETSFVAGASILHKLNLVHLPKLLILSHILFVLALLFVLILAVVYIRKTRRVRVSIAIGLSLTGFMAFFEILYFNLSKFIFGFRNNRYSGTLCILALIIVVTLFFDFVERSHGAAVEAAQKRLLENLAYMDELTALANRRKMDDTLMEYKAEHRNYAVLSMDMNFLKVLNDTYGHEMGDQALQFFAGCLLQVFEDPAVIGRMGGDEFAVIMENVTEEQVEECIQRMNELLGKDVFLETDIHLTCATGYAFSSECTESDDAYEIYRKSDNRMYRNKRFMKNEPERNNT